MSILGPYCPEHVRTRYDPKTVRSVHSFIPYHLYYPLSRVGSQAQECRPRCSLSHHFPGACYSSMRICAFTGQVPPHTQQCYFPYSLDGLNIEAGNGTGWGRGSIYLLLGNVNFKCFCWPHYFSPKTWAAKTTQATVGSPWPPIRSW